MLSGGIGRRMRGNTCPESMLMLIWGYLTQKVELLFSRMLG